jgi:carbon-monoxide dehydrogenase small subunit
VSAQIEGRRISLRVNGETHELEVEPRRLLVDLIRDDLDLTGTKIGCDTSQCGACTVHLDGRAVKSCTVLAVQADGRDIRTVESLAPDPRSLHPMQAAFVEHHGLQCGFCTPGMLMAAIDLVDRVGDPTEEQIRDAIHGNLCRCTGYQSIVESISAGAAAMRAGVAPPEAGDAR